eukprot:m.295150 g.295150  ORF g.295150 m.295150 type:complete len:113 (+) comp55145_c0_seq4:1741-2079(+)
MEDYVHRIGRTARAGAVGSAYTFFTSKNAPKARELIQILEEAHQPVDPKLRDMDVGGFGRGGELPFAFLNHFSCLSAFSAFPAACLCSGCMLVLRLPRSLFASIPCSSVPRI